MSFKTIVNGMKVRENNLSNDSRAKIKCSNSNETEERCTRGNPISNSPLVQWVNNSLNAITEIVTRGIYQKVAVSYSCKDISQLQDRLWDFWILLRCLCPKSHQHRIIV